MREKLLLQVGTRPKTILLLVVFISWPNLVQKKP